VDPAAKLIRNPLLVLDAAGVVTDMNTAAERLLGGRERGNGVFADRAALNDLLWRASGSSEPTFAALDVGADGGVRRFRVVAVALRTAETPSYLLEIRQAEEDQFAALTSRLRELNAEIAERRRVQATLQESLAHNRVLYRELQHRVKNHLQMMLALVSAAGRESADPGHRHFVQMLQAKLSALFDAQRLMYAEQNAQGVRADHMLNSIAETVQSLAPDSASIEVRAEPLIVPNDIAFPVALIANELLTNAAKYGHHEAGTRACGSLRRIGSEVVLEVRDNGPGFVAPSSGRASSGLGLVRGLCRQIGGRLDIASDAGAVVTVTFPAPEALHVVS